MCQSVWLSRYYERLIREDGLVLTIARSENGVYIQKLGTDEVYVEAIDVETTPYVYVETTKKIKK